MLDDAKAAESEERKAALRAERESEKFRESMRGLIAELQSEATKRIDARKPVEQEWLRDIEQIHGIYDPVTRQNFQLPEREGKSQLFMNKTREKVQTKVSVLMDTLFPSDDKNWGISPTPVPEMAAESEKIAIAAARLEEQASQDPSVAPQAVAARMEADRLAAIMQEAEDRARLMEDEIADQLEECRYAVHSRDVLEDGCGTGTGVMMGPMTDVKTKRSWVQAKDESGKPVEGVYDLEFSSDPKPAMYRANFWDFFPSVGATRPEDSEGFYLRHPWTPKQLRDFAKINGVDKDAVRRLIESGATDTIPDYLVQLRALSAEQSQAFDRVYTVWMYCGPLTPDQMRMLATAMDDEKTHKDMDEVDPLDEVQAIVWFCGGELLKMSIYPFDSGEPLFSVWCYEREPGSFWGYGIARIMRDDQKALNAGWRMMMDNGDQSAGPQILIDRNKIRPVNGSWVIRGSKLWEVLEGKSISGNEFATFDIPSKQAEMANIIELARRSIDESTHTPMMEQGEPGALPQQTAAGLALMMSATRRADKRLVQNWDDDFTTPNIRRMYDWNMQFSQKAEIKGDYQTTARGSSVLLVRTQNAQNVALMLSMFGADPEFKALEAKREFARAIGYRPDQFFITDTEAENLQEQQDPAAMIEMKKLEIAEAEIDLKRDLAELQRDEMDLKVSMAEMEADSRIEVAMIQQETAMMREAERLNMTMEQVRAKLTDAREARRSKERTIAAEIGVRSQAQAPANTTQIANQ